MRFDDLGDLALLCRGSQMADGVGAAAIAQAPEKPGQDIGDFGGSPASGGETNRSRVQTSGRNEVAL
jgi:hypothetical protein